jgi:Flp pilus assembly pilin Flp
MKELHNLFGELASDEGGNSVTEYSMIIAVTVVFVMVGISTVEHPISGFFEKAGLLFDELAEGNE